MSAAVTLEAVELLVPPAPVLVVVPPSPADTFRGRARRWLTLPRPARVTSSWRHGDRRLRVGRYVDPDELAALLAGSRINRRAVVKAPVSGTSVIEDAAGELAGLAARRAGAR